jgi:alpha-glucosidase/alpha-D-xyloside xylohydrolase
VNTALSGIPFWGTDIGGFVPTHAELTGELYVRWFQFGTFNPLFRSHGRSWQLRLPFGWNRGTVGISEWAATAAAPAIPRRRRCATSASSRSAARTSSCGID